MESQEFKLEDVLGELKPSLKRRALFASVPRMAIEEIKKVYVFGGVPSANIENVLVSRPWAMEILLIIRHDLDPWCQSNYIPSLAINEINVILNDKGEMHEVVRAMIICNNGA